MGIHFIINLTIADLLKVLFCMPFNSISSLIGRWVFGEFGCNLYGFFSSVFGYMSIVILALMSIERYLIVKDPFKSIEFSTKSKIRNFFSIVVVFFYLLFKNFNIIIKF